MAKPTAELARKFGNRARALSRTCATAETLLGKGVITLRDAELLYSASFMAAVTQLEGSVETLFLGLLSGAMTHSRPDVKPRVTFRNLPIARDVVFAGDDYLAWLPIERTTKRAKIFFLESRPFDVISHADRDLISRSMAIRNVLAHRSDYSVKKFESRVLAGLTLPPRSKTPAGFLRSRFRISPPESRFENLVADMYALVSRLC